MLVEEVTKAQKILKEAGEEKAYKAEGIQALLSKECLEVK